MKRVLTRVLAIGGCVYVIRHAVRYALSSWHVLMTDAAKTNYPAFSITIRFETSRFSVAVLVALAAFAAIISLASARWTTIRVFVAYQRDVSEMAVALAAALRKYGISAMTCSLPPNTPHDEVVGAVRQGILHSDTVVVLPGVRQSFVDAEILAASILNKPVLIICERGGRLPDTAYRGYPRLSYECISQREFRPLADLILAMHGSLSLLFLLTRSNAMNVSSAVMAVLLPSQFILSVGAVGSALWTLFSNQHHGLLIVQASVVISTVAAIIIVAPASVLANINRLKAMRLARQAIVTGTATHALLAASLPPLAKEGLTCLEISHPNAGTRSFK
jgi:hypothetical protein